MWLGVNDSIIFPPSEFTGWWSGYSPGPSGYTIFIQKPSQGPSIYSPANDSELITTVFRLAKSKSEFPTLNNVQDALDWLANQNETICVNFDYPSIVTDGLIFLADSAFTASYPKGGNTWKDISGSENHTTLINEPTYSSEYQGVLDFDSALLQYATGPDLGTLSNFTVSCWVKLTTLPTFSGAPAIVTNVYDQESKLNFSIGLNRFLDSSNICFGFYDGAWRTTDGFAPSINTWYNIVGTYDGSVIRQYVNGVQNTVLAYVGIAQSSGLGIRIARRWDSIEISDNFIDGQIPVVKIYNRALTDSEILLNYNSLTPRFPQPITTTTSTTSTSTTSTTTTSTSTSTTTTTTAPPTSTTTTTSTTSTTSSTTTTTTSAGGGIVSSNLFMHLDASNPSSYSGSGSTWFDLTANLNNGTISGSTWSSTDGGLFDFDGINDTISVAHNSSLSLSTTVQRTVQVWVKFDTLPAVNQQVPVFGKLSGSFGFDGYWGGLFSNSGVVRCVTNGTGVQRISSSTLTVTTNTWYLFTFISQITSGAGTTKVYINETEYISTAHGADSYSESNPFYLGFIGSGIGSLYLDGKIGACYFYTSGLSAANISTNFNATKSRYGL
jgi:hypothetical protein